MAATTGASSSESSSVDALAVLGMAVVQVKDMVFEEYAGQPVGLTVGRDGDDNYVCMDENYRHVRLLSRGLVGRRVRVAMSHIVSDIDD